MRTTDFGVHEVVDLRELTVFKAACVTEAKNRLDKIENPDLKRIVEQSIKQGTESLVEMKRLLSAAATQFDQ